MVAPSLVEDCHNTQVMHRMLRLSETVTNPTLSWWLTLKCTHAVLPLHAGALATAAAELFILGWGSYSLGSAAGHSVGAGAAKVVACFDTSGSKTLQQRNDGVAGATGGLWWRGLSVWVSPVVLLLRVQRLLVLWAG